MQLRVLASFTLLACSNNTGGFDAGLDVHSDGLANGFTQRGQVVQAQGTNGVAGAVVSGGGSTATADSNGTYTLIVPKMTPYTMQIVGPGSGSGFVTFVDQEWEVLGNANRGVTPLTTMTQQAQILSVLTSPTPDPTLAMLAVQVTATNTCQADAGGPDVNGATVTVSGSSGGDAGVDGGADGGGGGPVVVYINSSGVPDYTVNSVTPGQVPSAIIYNLPPMAAFKSVSVTQIGCKPRPFPVADQSDPNILYSGNVELVPFGPSGKPQVVSFVRLYLE